MRALLLLETAVVKNNLLRLVRSPLRLTLWSLYIAALVIGSFLRVHAGAHYQSALSLLSPSLATAFAGAYLGVLGCSIAYHALGHLKAFRSPAEALLFTNAGLSSRTITLWLQACKLFALITRWFWVIALNVIIFSPEGVAPNDLMRCFIASIAGAALLLAIEIPAFLLGRTRFGRLVAAAGLLIAIGGVAYMLLGLAAADGNRPAAAIVTALAFDPGPTVAGLLRGSPERLTFFLFSPLIVSLALVALGADAVPELYAASLHAFEIFKRNRSATLGAVFEYDQKKRRQGWVPSGAFVLLWKEWLAFCRRRWARLMWSALLALAIGTGVCMGGIARQTHHETEGWALLWLISAFAFLVPLFASIGLADDVAKPIFWMTTRSLRASLLIWTFARSWRGAILVDTLLVVAAACMGDRVAALLLPPAGAALWFSLNAMGILIYALFPNRFDEHGPVYLVRMLAAIALLVPCAIVASTAALLKQSTEITVLYASLALLFEAVAALEIAALRLKHNSAD